MNIQRVTIARTNYGRGRSGRKIEAIVIHVSEGTMESMTSWFQNEAAKVSAHYGVSREGKVVQYVPDEDTAWHAGRVLRPTAKLVRLKPGVNPNQWTIGIEHAGTHDKAPTLTQLAASGGLIALLAGRYNIPLDRDHVIGHREIYAAKDCPGPIDLEELLILARKAREQGDVILEPTPPVRPVLRQGAKGENVRALQVAIGVPDTGEFDAQTDGGVRAFQKCHGLAIDAIVGPKTWAVIERQR